MQVTVTVTSDGPATITLSGLAGLQGHTLTVDGQPAAGSFSGELSTTGGTTTFVIT